MKLRTFLKYLEPPDPNRETPEQRGHRLATEHLRRKGLIPSEAQRVAAERGLARVANPLPAQPTPRKQRSPRTRVPLHHIPAPAPIDDDPTNNGWYSDSGGDEDGVVTPDPVAFGVDYDAIKARSRARATPGGLSLLVGQKSQRALDVFQQHLDEYDAATDGDDRNEIWERLSSSAIQLARLLVLEREANR